MKFLKKHYILTLSLFICLVIILFMLLRPAEPVIGPQENLAAAELTLQQQQDELASMLRAFYMGHATERETKRLIDKVEAQRLLVEELRQLQ